METFALIFEYDGLRPGYDDTKQVNVTVEARSFTEAKRLARPLAAEKSGRNPRTLRYCGATLLIAAA